MHLHLEPNYDAVLRGLGEQRFFIFGTTLYAQIFYLHCLGNGVADNIAAFVLSDLSRLAATRKLPQMHGVPIIDVDQLRREPGIKAGFMAVTDRALKEILPLMRSIDAEVFCVSGYVHQVMYQRYSWLSHEKLLERYMVSANPYDNKGWCNISDLGSKKTYKWLSRVPNGELFDLKQGMTLDEMCREQLGDYEAIPPNIEKCESAKICKIYLAQSHADRSLLENFDTPCTYTIQVGAALTEREISQLRDDTGENISHRNRDYCEMTAVYWAWKNDKESDYIGLCHYRRRFVLDENTLLGIMSKNYDAVYTIPKLTDGGMRKEFVEGNYYLTPEMWELMGKTIEKLSPEYSASWNEFGRAYFLIPCNMFIMRRDVFHGYCQWAFSILEEVDRFYLDQGIQRNDRYLGYIAECLNTVYAMKHKDTLKKCYAEFKLLESK